MHCFLAEGSATKFSKYRKDAAYQTCIVSMFNSPFYFPCAKYHFMKPFRAPYTALLARCSDQLSQWFFVQPESRTGDPQLFFFANDYNVERQLDSLAIAITTQKFAGFMCSMYVMCIQGLTNFFGRHLVYLI